MPPRPGPIVRVFILCGLPFAGKSTMGRALADRFGLVHVEVDAAMAAQGFDFAARRPEKADWLAAYTAGYRQLDTALAAGRSAVWDATSYRKGHRDRIRRIATQRGAMHTVIHLATPEALALGRRDRNRQVRRRPDVADEDFATVAGDWQAPGEDESPLVYHPATPLADWLDATIAPLLARDARPLEEPA
jgi:predicted kinase